MQAKLLLLAVSAAVLSGTSALAQGDECTGALAVVTGANGPYTNVGATQSQPPMPCVFGVTNDVWFSWVASCTGTVIVDTCGGGFDTGLEVFDGTAGCGGLVAVGCNDDFCGLQSQVSFQGTAGTTYYIRVGGYNGASGSFPLNISCTPPQPNTLTTNYFGNTYLTAPAVFFFDVTVNIPLVINQFDINTNSPVGTAGTLDIYTVPNTYVGNDTNPAAWTLVTTGSVTSAGPGLPSTVTMNPFPLAAGPYGIAIQYNGLDPLYGPQAGTFTTPEMTLVTGASAAGPLGTAICCTPREWNGTIRYGQAPSGSVIAARNNYGLGCYEQHLSFYQLFQPALFDLANSSFQMVYTGAGYLVSTGSTNWFTPVSVPLTMGDDTVSTQTLPFTIPYSGGTTSTIGVCSNGFAWLGASTNAPYTPSSAGLLTDAARVCALWTDLYPPSGGSIYYDVDPSNTVAYATWVGVPTISVTSDVNTFQIAFFSSGIIEVRYQTCAASQQAVLTGFSPGGGAVDPGNIDLSAAILQPLITGPELVPLRLDASARPLIGTTFNFVTSNLNPATPFGFQVINFAGVVPGINLGSIGMPDCYQHIALNGAATILFFTGGAPTASIPFAIPNQTIYLGQNLFGQSVASLAGANPLGYTTSNGVRLLVGNL